MMMKSQIDIFSGILPSEKTLEQKAKKLDFSGRISYYQG
jgi:hypothetical protein